MVQQLNALTILRHIHTRVASRFGRRSFIAIVLSAIALSTPDHSVAAPRDGSFNSAGVTIHYIEEGAGQAVILIHGFTNTAQNWVRSGIFGELAKSYRVVAIDCRGHGQSDKPHEPEQYGREMGRDIVRLLDHLNIARAHIVGYSMGGGIVAQLLTENPERFLSATLGGNAGRREWTAEDQERMETEAAEMEEGILRSQYRRLAATNAAPPTDEEIRQRSEDRLSGLDRIALAALSRSRAQFVQTAEQMAAIEVPTLGIVGSLDPAVRVYRELQTMMPQLQLVVIDGAAHGEAPARPEFIQALTAFLERSSA